MKRIMAVICLLALVAGCSWFSHKPEKSADQLAREGVEAFNKGDYSAAIDAFDKLRNWYPFSKYLILAELKLADAYFHRKRWEEAIVAYKHFERMHPNNEAVPYVVFQTGMSYFKQMRTPDRDQTPARMALVNFQRLRKQFPNSPYAKQCIDPIVACNRNLAEHDLLVGRFYLRRKHYKAALDRFENIITSYADTGVHERALSLIAKARAHITPLKPESSTH